MERKILGQQGQNGEVIQDITQLTELYNMYLAASQTGETITIIEKRLERMGDRKANLWRADRLRSMGVEIDENLLQELQNENREINVGNKESRRRANLASATKTELNKNRNRTNASLFRFQNNI